LDQFAVYYERIPDEAQQDHFDWGWRVTSLYGQDYRFTTSKGMLSQQLLVKDAQYGWDPVMFYPVSYTHLDVYKRQPLAMKRKMPGRDGGRGSLDCSSCPSP